MGFFEAVYALWRREIIVFFREKERIISAIVTPLMWIFVFGGGMGASVSVGNVNYQTFVFPGIVSMAVLFSSIFYGMYIIWDRKLDFLKEVLVSPVPRSAVFLGKLMGGMSDSMLQAGALLIIGMLAGFVSGVGALVLALFAVFALAACMGSLGLIIGSNMKSPEGFNLVMSFVMWPMFLLSGSLFPMENLPVYLDVLVHVNPMTYGVDLVRFALLGNTAFGVLTDVLVLAGFTAVFVFFGTRSFEKMQV